MSRVSLITITQYKRINFLDLLFESVKKAVDYADNCTVTEWIFVDGSTTFKQSELVSKKLHQLRKKFNLPVKCYFPNSSKRNIGFLREYSNSKVSDDTEYVIVQDDDDYMMPMRIKETIKLFKKHEDCQLIGTGDQLMWDHDTDTVFTFDMSKHPPYHAVNSTYAYTYTYLQRNHYDTDKTFAEEGSFTKTPLGDFTQKMYHLSPFYCIVQMSHSVNTYNKFTVKSQALSLPQYGLDTLSVVFKPEVSLEYLLGDDMALKYRNLCDNESDRVKDKKKYDISYYCGVHSIDWHPKDILKLGGSEQAVVYLAENWAKKGKKVQVFLRCPELEFQLDPFVHNGVTYKHCNKFSFRDTYDTLILWRVSGLFLLNPYIKVKANKLFVDLHDHNPEQYRIMFEAHYEVIDKIFFKTEFHKAVADHQFNTKQFSDPKAVIIPNGIEYDLFRYKSSVKKEPYRFQYSSSYFRGLKDILKYMWPKIVEKIPEAELHVYYGFNDSDPEKERKEIEDLIRDSPNVFDHGRVSRKELALEKMKASYHLYPTFTPAEICCISLKESLLAENVLILTSVNLYGQFPGLKLEYSQGYPTDQYYNKFGDLVADSILDPEKKEMFDNLRSTGKDYDQIKTWKSVSELWNAHF